MLPPPMDGSPVKPSRRPIIIPGSLRSATAHALAREARLAFDFGDSVRLGGALAALVDLVSTSSFRRS
jgi:hypothetical protein